MNLAQKMRQITDAAIEADKDNVYIDGICHTCLIIIEAAARSKESSVDYTIPSHPKLTHAAWSEIMSRLSREGFCVKGIFQNGINQTIHISWSLAGRPERFKQDTPAQELAVIYQMMWGSTSNFRDSVTETTQYIGRITKCVDDLEALMPFLNRGYW